MVVGLDPGEATGYAEACARTGALVAVDACPFWDAARRLSADARAGRVALVVIEDARGLPLYARHRGLPREARDRAARSVGRVDVQTDLLVQLAERLGLPVRLAEPSKAAKWDAATLRRLAGWTARTNAHGRDAARLVLGVRAPSRLPPR